MILFCRNSTLFVFTSKVNVSSSRSQIYTTLKTRDSYFGFAFTRQGIWLPLLRKVRETESGNLLCNCFSITKWLISINLIYRMSLSRKGLLSIISITTLALARYRFLPAFDSWLGASLLANYLTIRRQARGFYRLIETESEPSNCVSITHWPIYWTQNIARIDLLKVLIDKIQRRLSARSESFLRINSRHLCSQSDCAITNSRSVWLC